MILSEIGSIVKIEWIKTPEIRPDMNLILDAFCATPNHFHAIICIGENEYNKREHLHFDGAQHRDAMHRVSTNPTHEPNSIHQPIQN